MSQLFAQAKETEDVVTRRVSRRVDRYLEKLRKESLMSREAHPVPAPPLEFEDDAPTLILKSRASSGAGFRSSSAASVAPSIPSIPSIPSGPVSRRVPDSSRDSPDSLELPKGKADRDKPVQSDSNFIEAAQTNVAPQRPRAFVPEALGATGVVGIRKLNLGDAPKLNLESPFEKSPSESLRLNLEGSFESDAENSAFDENTVSESGYEFQSEKSEQDTEIDLKRFAEVSQIDFVEKKNKSSDKEVNDLSMISKLAEDDRPPILISSRSSLLVFAIIGLAVLAVLYFLLTFDKYVY